MYKNTSAFFQEIGKAGLSNPSTAEWRIQQFKGPRGKTETHESWNYDFMHIGKCVNLSVFVAVFLLSQQATSAIAEATLLCRTSLTA